MNPRVTILLIALSVIAGLATAQQSMSIAIRNSQTNVKSDGARKYVEIKWQTTLECGFSFYTLQRSLPDSSSMTDSSSWRDIARIDTVTTADSVKSYGFIDYPSIIASYRYRVKLVTSDNNEQAYLSIGGVVSASSLTKVSTLKAQDIPRGYDCISNYPNPFNPTTTIVLNLQRMEQGSLNIYDLYGRKLETLAEGSLASGVHRYQWDASKYSSGTYFCVLQTRNQVTTAKLIFQK